MGAEAGYRPDGSQSRRTFRQVMRDASGHIHDRLPTGRQVRRAGFAATAVVGAGTILAACSSGTSPDRGNTALARPSASATYSETHAGHSPTATPKETPSPKPVEVGTPSQVETSHGPVDFYLVTPAQLKGLTSQELSDIATKGLRLGILMNPNYATDQLNVTTSMQPYTVKNQNRTAIFGEAKFEDGRNMLVALNLSS